MHPNSVKVPFMNKFIASCALGVAVTVLPLEAALAETKMSSQALRALFPGHFKGKVQGMVDIAFTATANGRLYGKIMGKTDRGRWKVARGKLCIALADLTDGKYRCSSVKRDGQWFRAYQGTTISFRKL